MKRWPLYCAIAYVVLVGAGLFALPAPPEVSASGARLVRYLQDHGSGVRLATWLATWAAVPLVLLIAHLRSRLVGIGRDVMLLGAVGLIVPTIVWSWFNAGLALHAEHLDPSVARTVADVGAYFGAVLTVSVILMVSPIGLTAWRREGGLPRWFAWATAVFAAEQAVESITVFGRRGFFAPAGAMNFTLGAGLFVVWIVLAGVASSPAP